MIDSHFLKLGLLNNNVDKFMGASFPFPSTTIKFNSA
jgi:hypothetical protein